MYEPLIIRDTTGGFEPALATDWALSAEDPNVWVFNLRQGVQFHGGTYICNRCGAGEGKRRSAGLQGSHETPVT